MEEEKIITKYILFDTYHCDGIEEYESFLNNINPGESVAMLVAAIGKAQTFGIYNKIESDVLAKSINRLVNNDKIENNEISN
jgi:hypothetical protein